MSELEKKIPTVPVDPQEPAWIRDTQAADIDIDISDMARIPDMLAKIAETETAFCEYCGAKFPMWPLKGWSDHVLTEHSPLMTIQARKACTMLCEDGLTQAHQAYFQMMFFARVSMRRRAHQLGFMVVKPGRIHLEN